MTDREREGRGKTRRKKKQVDGGKKRRKDRKSEPRGERWYINESKDYEEKWRGIGGGRKEN